jgi:DNA-binding NtrC family response regulator
MPLDTQAFLLRVLESGEFIRVGSSRSLKTDVRVIAASNVDLLDRIRQGRFREDLYYRLNTVPIRVPPLAERKEDIGILFRKFAVDFAEKYRTSAIQLAPEAEALVESYHWPGNIRELKNVVEQLSVLHEDQMITAEDLVRSVPNIQRRYLPTLPDTGGLDGTGNYEREILYKLLFDMKTDLTDLKQLVFELIKNNDLHVPDIQKMHELQPMSERQVPPPSWPSQSPSLQPHTSSSPLVIDSSGEMSYHLEEAEEDLSIEAMEKELISRALTKHKGRRKDAADELGISERTLYRKIKLYNL